MPVGKSKCSRRAGEKSLIALCLAASLLAVSPSLFAQEPTSAPPDKPMPAASGTSPTAEKATEANVDLMRENIRAERKKIVAANLPLTAEEATKFWPLYDRYIADTIKVNDQRYALVKQYAQSYSNLSDAQASDYIKRWIALDQDNTQLRMKYIPEFQKIISPKKTAMFFQMDRRLGMLIELQLASQVPLVKP